MTKLTIIAHITAHAGKVEFLKRELEKLLVPTRNEPGCLQDYLKAVEGAVEDFTLYEMSHIG